MVFVCQYVCNPNEKSPELVLNCLPFLGHKKWEAFL